MAAAAWMVQVQQQAREMEVRCVRAVRALTNAADYLAPPMLVAETQTARGRIQVMRHMLRSASDDLILASNATTAAELLALRGAAANPTAPLPSIEHIPDGYHDMRLALGLFQSARASALAACNSAEKCCGYLKMAFDTLLIAPGLPVVDDLLESRRLFAIFHIKAAQGSSVVSAALAVVANWLVH